MSEEFFTVIFRGDIRKFKGSPFKAETVFGEVFGVAVGNLAQQYDAADQEASDEIQRLTKERDETAAERDLLQEVLDSRPAINAGLPDTYIRWSQSIYSGDVIRAALASDGKRGGE